MGQVEPEKSAVSNYPPAHCQGGMVFVRSGITLGRLYPCWWDAGVARRGLSRFFPFARHVRIAAENLVRLYGPSGDAVGSPSRTCATVCNWLQRALLEADVSLPVVKQFMGRVSEQAVGETVLKSLNPTNQLIYIVHQELVNLMGPVDHSLHLRPGHVGVDALRPSGFRQDDHLRQTGPFHPRGAANRCWWRPTCSGPPPFSSCKCSASSSKFAGVCRPDATDPVALCQAAVKHAKEPART